ncbi:MAG: N-acetyltransferase [Candidatus Aenigmarchaeota archaeon]|nr:N-acetyltransferase [Candidatus Aenigmarchaeota archaeon]
MVIVRKAKISDAEEIKTLIDFYAKQNIMLPRSIYDIFENIREFSVATINKNIVGCCALHIFGKEYSLENKREEFVLAEIRSLAAKEEWRNQGIGTKLVKYCLEEGKRIGVTATFTLTVKENTGFFKRLGFKEIEKTLLPQKIWRDCIRCPKFPSECNEIALIKYK